MASPLDDALRRLDTPNATEQKMKQHDDWLRYLARKKVVEAIGDFLQRMSAMGIEGVDQIKVGFRRYEHGWYVRWSNVYKGEIFFLATDGRVESQDYSMRNDWTPYQSAMFFSVDGQRATEIANAGDAPMSMDFKDRQHMPKADGIVYELAVILKASRPG